MAWCPNPDCPHQHRCGRAAEYRPGVERCTDCGSELVQAHPFREQDREKPVAPGWPADLGKRIGATLGVLAVLLGLSFVPPLGVEPGMGQPGQLSQAAGPLSAGVRPLLVGFVLVELAALIWPGLRRRRLGDAALRRKLWSWSLGTGIGIAFFQGVMQAIYLESFWHYGPQVWEPGWAFRLSHGLLVAGGSGLCALAAFFIERFGLGRGFAVLLLFEAGRVLAGIASGAAGLAAAGEIAALEIAVALGAVVAFVLGLRWFFRFADDLAGPGGWRVPVCGLFPLDVAVQCAVIPVWLGNFAAISGGWYEIYLAQISPGRWGYLALQLGVVLLLALPASAMFYWRYRQGFAERAPGQWRLARWLSAVFLAGLVILDSFCYHAAPFMALLWPGALVLLGAYALADDLLVEIAARRRSPQGELAAVGAYQDPADAIAALTRLHQLQPQRRFALTGLRFRSLTYFFAPYVPLVIYRLPEDARGG
ncbi:MAG: hypothetical protein JXR96_27760 [Deltaproteobacteria bacterium]|nr:hypothetical protein [Deltaproteobacteria bacterium]